MGGGGVVVRHALTAVIKQLAFQRQSIGAKHPRRFASVVSGLFYRCLVIQEVRYAVTVAIVIEIDPAVAIGIFHPGGVIGLNVLDQEDIVVIVVVHPRIVLNHDIGIGNDVACCVFRYVDANQMAVVFIPIEVGARRANGINGVLVEVGVRVGPGNVALASADFREEAEGSVTIQCGGGQQVAVIKRARQQRLPILLVVSEYLVTVTAIHIVDKQPCHVALGVIRRQLGNLDR